MGAPHVHAEVIKAWADGERVQVRHMSGPIAGWLDLLSPGEGPSFPAFNPGQEYRVKPDPYQHLKDAVAAGKGIQYLSSVTGKWHYPLDIPCDGWKFSNPVERYRVIETGELPTTLADDKTGRRTDLTIVFDYVADTGEVIDACVKEFP